MRPSSKGPTSRWRALVCSCLGVVPLLRWPARRSRSLARRQSTEPALADEQWRVAVAALAYRSLVAGELGRVDEQTLLADEAVQARADAWARRGEGRRLRRARRIARSAGGARGGAVLTRAGRRNRASLGASGPARPRADPPGSPSSAMDRHEAAAAAIEEARAAVDSCADPGTLAEWLAALERPPRTRRRNGDGALSERELVILRMLTSRLSERDIGRELYLSHNTIHSHTQSIYRKLGASSRSEALYACARARV